MGHSFTFILIFVAILCGHVSPDPLTVLLLSVKFSLYIVYMF